MVEILIVGVGGFVGAVARYGLSTLVQRLAWAPFPLGTLFVNVLGCLVIGVLLGAGEGRQLLNPHARLCFTVGLLGSLTTFSTFGHETLELLSRGSGPMAIGNVLANVALGLGAVWAGRMLLKMAWV